MQTSTMVLFAYLSGVLVMLPVGLIRNASDFRSPLPAWERVALVGVPVLAGMLLWPVYLAIWVARGVGGWITDRVVA